MKQRVVNLKKDLRKFVDKHPDPKLNSATNTFFSSTTSSFYFSTDFNFEASIRYLESCEKKASDKLRIALLLGESFFLSMLPELKKHVDMVIIVDIDPKVLKTASYLHELMDRNEHCINFSDEFVDKEKNLLVQSNWDTYVCQTKGSKKFNTKITKEIALKLFLANNALLGEKHFIETDQRYAKCRASLEKLEFDFVLLDLLNKSSVDEFKNILERNNAIITVMNVNNLFDYDANYAVRNIREGAPRWTPTGMLYTNLKRLAEKQPSPIILFSRLDQKKEYTCLISCQTNSVDGYIELTTNYVNEMNELIGYVSPNPNEIRNSTSLSVAAESKTSIYRSVFHSLKPTATDREEIQAELANLKGMSMP